MHLKEPLLPVIDAVDTSSLHLANLMMSLRETRYQEELLRRQVESAIEEKIMHAKMKIHDAKKEMDDAERALREMRGVVDEEIDEANSGITYPNSRMDSSTWNWFHRELGNRAGIGIDADEYASLDQPQLDSANTSQISEKGAELNYWSMKRERNMEIPEPMDSQSDSGLSMAPSASLGSLAPSLSSHRSGSAPSQSTQSTTAKMASPLVAIRKDSLVTLLRAFDQILLYETA